MKAAPRANQPPDMPVLQKGSNGRIYTAARLAVVLGLSGRAVRKRLQGMAATLMPGPYRRDASGWPWEDLPDDWRDRISGLARRKGYRTAQELVCDQAAGPWLPPIQFSSVAERFRSEAYQWRDALLKVLPRQHDLAPGELLKLGVQECRRAFNREISEATWRRHFDLTAKRDNGFEQWGRVDLYLPEEAFNRAMALTAPTIEIERDDLAPLTDAFSQVGNPSKLTVEDRDSAWKAILESQAPREAVLDYAFRSLPGLARTTKALGKAYRRKLHNPTDNRPGRSGRKGPVLCPECERNLIGAAVDLDGDIAQAWRRLHLENKLCAKCSGLWHFDVRTNKSYVPLAVRNQVAAAVLEGLSSRHGPKWTRALQPYVLRRRDIGPGDVFESDDVTWNHVFYLWDSDDAGKPYVGRGECLLFLDRSSWYPLGYRLIAGEIDSDGKQRAAHYTGVDIRLGVLHVHDRVGLPHLGFQFENSVWRSRMVVGRKVRGWRFNLWRDFESGLNEQGILFGQAAVRHALPGNPRTKIIERVIRSVQERMRPLPGFVGFNHREYKPEILDDFLRRVKIGKEHPGQMFLSFAQFREALDTELMAYASEVQNGRLLPGVSPLEVWQNGIGQFPGVAVRPLRKLAPTARHLLSTHWRKVNVTAQGIRFEVGSKSLVFWGDELLSWKHKTIPARWNIEEPELLHCLPPGGTPFTMQSRELNSWTATSAELSKTAADRNRWTPQRRAGFDNLAHPLTSQITRDTEHRAEVHAVGQAISLAVEDHRERTALAAKEAKRLAALATTLGMETGEDEAITPRAIEARKRRLARADVEPEAVL